MTHTDYLNAHIDGKTIQYEYVEALNDEYAWTDIFTSDGMANGHAMNYLLTGKQREGYEVALRIKP